MVARVLPDRPRPLTEVYAQIIDEAVLGEALGFSSWRIAEHHFAEDQHNPSQFPLLAAVATRTERIRLGTYVLLLALHDPIRVAEDTATVDILSGGRMDLAVGAGPMVAECEAFGLDRSEAFGRTYEALEVIRRYTGVRMTTSPVQGAALPIYVAALGPQSLVVAGTKGYSLASVLHTPMVGRYTEAQRAAGRTRSDYRLMSGPVVVHVAESDEQAWDEAEEALHWWVSFYRARGFNMPLPPLGELRRTPGAGIFHQPFAVGSPDHVLEVMRAYEGVDLDEMVIQFNHPGMPPEPVARSMRLFAEEIMPEVSTWGAAAEPADHST